MSDQRLYTKEEETRLATSDEKGHRIYVHPEDVKGPWKQKRKFLYWALIGIYLVVPWITINGQQQVLLDITHRRFHFFGLTFWAHEMPIIFFLLLGAALTLFFITSIWGRIWCGWACPQTVFIDAIFRPIERLVEGRARARKALDARPWDAQKISKKVLKWLLFTLASLHISHSFLGYFVGTHNLLEMSLHSPTENLPLFMAMIFFTAITLFDFGWFREQFCIIMCPYGRFQSVLMDSDSLVVAYDYKRGEPRRTKHNIGKDEGDCIDCHACVKVCPTGIDIRRGTQLECIACTQCIDACNDIMAKVGRAPNLIRYDSENGLENLPHKKFKFRSFVYLFLIIGTLSSFVYTVSHRGGVDTVFVRGKNAFQIVHNQSGEKQVLNHFRVELSYQGEGSYNIFFQLPEKLQEKGYQLVTPIKPFPLKQDKKSTTNVFIRFPQKLFKGSEKIFVYILNGEEINTAKRIDTKEITLVGPAGN